MRWNNRWSVSFFFKITFHRPRCCCVKPDTSTRTLRTRLNFGEGPKITTFVFVISGGLFKGFKLWCKRWIQTVSKRGTCPKENISHKHKHKHHSGTQTGGEDYDDTPEWNLSMSTQMITMGNAKIRMSSSRVPCWTMGVVSVDDIVMPYSFIVVGMCVVLDGLSLRQLWCLLLPWWCWWCWWCWWWWW